MQFAVSFAAALLISAPGPSAAYQLVQEYSGSNFFSGWDFYGNYDNLTNGDVNWVSAANATASDLAYVNDAGNAIIKVDNTTDVIYNYKRDTVRISSQDYYELGSVFVIDAIHLPYGCSVWPSFWTKGENWPVGGEIDIIESVNLMTYNQMALHTENGCNQASSVTQSGTTGSSTNCSQSSGCTVEENQSNSFGAGFASAGGGVWATQFDTSGINIWFWTRDSVPSSVSDATDSIDISSWGTPSANYPSSSCDVAEYFTAQQLVIDITLCGDWAGEASVYEATCGGDGSSTACYLNNVIGSGSNYSNAYFEISYVKVFSNSSTVLVPTTSDGSFALATATATTSAGSSSSSSSSGSSSGALSADLHIFTVLLCAMIVAGSSWIFL